MSADDGKIGFGRSSVWSLFHVALFLLFFRVAAQSLRCESATGVVAWIRTDWAGEAVVLLAAAGLSLLASSVGRAEAHVKEAAEEAGFRWAFPRLAGLSALNVAYVLMMTIWITSENMADFLTTVSEGWLLQIAMVLTVSALVVAWDTYGLWNGSSYIDRTRRETEDKVHVR